MIITTFIYKIEILTHINLTVLRDITNLTIKDLLNRLKN